MSWALMKVYVRLRRLARHCEYGPNDLRAMDDLAPSLYRQVRAVPTREINRLPSPLSIRLQAVAAEALAISNRKRVSRDDAPAISCARIFWDCTQALEDHLGLYQESFQFRKSVEVAESAEGEGAAEVGASVEVVESGEGEEAAEVAMTVETSENPESANIADTTNISHSDTSEVLVTGTGKSIEDDSLKGIYRTARWFEDNLEGKPIKGDNLRHTSPKDIARGDKGARLANRYSVADVIKFWSDYRDKIMRLLRSEEAL